MKSYDVFVIDNDSFQSSLSSFSTQALGLFGYGFIKFLSVFNLSSHFSQIMDPNRDIDHESIFKSLNKNKLFNQTDKFKLIRLIMSILFEICNATLVADP